MNLKKVNYKVIELHLPLMPTGGSLRWFVMNVAQAGDKLVKPKAVLDLLRTVGFLAV